MVAGDLCSGGQVAEGLVSGEEAEECIGMEFNPVMPWPPLRTSRSSGHPLSAMLAAKVAGRLQATVFS